MISNKKTRCFQHKKAAIELSMGTIVIVVLAMSMLILGIVLIRTIFTTATNAIGGIDDGVRKSINDLFNSDTDKKMAVYPATSVVTIKQRTDGYGFAFSVRNVGNKEEKFTYSVSVDSQFNIQKKCQSITVRDAEEWLLQDAGEFTLGPGASMEEPQKVLFNIPDGAPPCTIPYKVEIKKSGQAYDYRTVYLKILAR